MRRLVVNEFMSLDGVAQAPGGEDEDPSGGFAHGGWHSRFTTEAGAKAVAEGIVAADAFLLGRRTYELFASYWPNASEAALKVGGPLNTRPKYVASRTLSGPLAWQNSTLLQGDVVEAVRALKQSGSGVLHLIGSLDLLQTLTAHDLVDEYRLMIDPVVLGGGKRVFREDGQLRPLRLVDSQITTTGVIMATYVPTRDHGN